MCVINPAPAVLLLYILDGVMERVEIEMGWSDAYHPSLTWSELPTDFSCTPTPTQVPFIFACSLIPSTNTFGCRIDDKRRTSAVGAMKSDASGKYTKFAPRFVALSMIPLHMAKFLAIEEVEHICATATSMCLLEIKWASKANTIVIVYLNKNVSTPPVRHCA